MKWSWKLGTVAGIEVRLHMTFVLLVGWILMSHWMAGRTLAAAVGGVAFTAAVFACVLLHEFGHSLAAARYGIRTRDITLYPIGGAARLERMPEDPRQELWVALAGPAVNVAIGVLLYAWLEARHLWQPLGELSVAGGSFAERLLVANAFLVGFNLLPAFPMDGGRVLRSLLARRMPFERATSIAAGLGQGMAFLFGLAGLFWNPFLLFIALFVWMGAAQEAEAVRLKSVVAGVPVRSAMMTSYRDLAPSDTLGRAAALLLQGAQQEFPVVSDGRAIGILTREALLEGLTKAGRAGLVGHYMQVDLHSVEVEDPLEGVLPRVAESAHGVVAVIENGRLAGLLSRENLAEMYLLEAAVRR